MLSGILGVLAGIVCVFRPFSSAVALAWVLGIWLIVRGIVEIAHSLGKLVTAEGVETLEQVELLCAMGCDHLQGWHFGKACAPDRLRDVLSSLAF